MQTYNISFMVKVCRGVVSLLDKIISSLLFKVLCNSANYYLVEVNSSHPSEFHYSIAFHNCSKLQQML